MARDTELSTYVDAETKAQLQREADERDMTLSTYTARLIDPGRTANAEESMTARTGVEAALERTIEESIASYHDELLDAVRKASVYSIATTSSTQRQPTLRGRLERTPSPRVGVERTRHCQSTKRRWPSTVPPTPTPTSPTTTLSPNPPPTPVLDR